MFVVQVHRITLLHGQRILSSHDAFHCSLLTFKVQHVICSSAQSSASRLASLQTYNPVTFLSGRARRRRLSELIKRPLLVLSPSPPAFLPRGRPHTSHISCSGAVTETFLGRPGARSVSFSGSFWIGARWASTRFALVAPPSLPSLLSCGVSRGLLMPIKVV